MKLIEELVNNAVLTSIILAPITVGILEVIKTAIQINKRYQPLLALIVGIVTSVLIALGTNQDLVQFILVGVIGGLGAAGLYDQGDILNK